MREDVFNRRRVEGADALVVLCRVAEHVRAGAQQPLNRRRPVELLEPVRAQNDDFLDLGVFLSFLKAFQGQEGREK